jgi:glutamate-5-semialdehyde dehydrogenase
MDLKASLEVQGERAKQAAAQLATADGAVKNQALLAMADALERRAGEIIAANQADWERASSRGMSPAMLDRLALGGSRIEAMADGVRQIAALPDPIGEAVTLERRPNGLDIAKLRVPIGVLAVIYEARPNVTADAAALCLKSGNAVILKGGGEASCSNRAIAGILAEAAEEAGIPAGAIQMVDSADRESGLLLMQMTEYIDVLIPRGGAGLKTSLEQYAKVPYIMTGMGNCHIYVDRFADRGKVTPIVLNAKVQRPSVCNAAETLLVHRAAEDVLTPLVSALRSAGVEIRGCERVRALIGDVTPATEQDWDEEYNDLILAVKIVDSLEEAISHINRHGTRHSEAIITENYARSRRFMRMVDAAAVYTNASTRFTDGGEFGFGAELGISTQKLHARGPMGLRELTTVKYMVYGDGQIR